MRYKLHFQWIILKSSFAICFHLFFNVVRYNNQAQIIYACHVEVVIKNNIGFSDFSLWLKMNFTSVYKFIYMVRWPPSYCFIRFYLLQVIPLHYHKHLVTKVSNRFHNNFFYRLQRPKIFRETFLFPDSAIAVNIIFI